MSAEDEGQRRGGGSGGAGGSTARTPRRAGAGPRGAAERRAEPAGQTGAKTARSPPVVGGRVVGGGCAAVGEGGGRRGATPPSSSLGSGGSSSGGSSSQRRRRQPRPRQQPEGEEEERGGEVKRRQPPQQQRRGGREQPKTTTTDAFRDRPRKREHALPTDAAPSKRRLTEPRACVATASAPRKMLKQCPSPADVDTELDATTPSAVLQDLADEVKKEPLQDDKPKDEEPELDTSPAPAEEEAESSQPTAHAPTMTTATSPPPPPRDTEQPSPQQQQQQHGGDARPEATATALTECTESAPLGARLVCAVCDGVLPSEAALAAHIQDLGLNHTGAEAESQRGFACSACRRVFADAKALDRHAPSHPVEQVLKCPLCGLGLRTNGGLARHTRRHLDGDRPPRQGLAAKRAHPGATAAEDETTDYEVEAKRRSPASDGDPAPAPSLPPVVPRFTCPVCPPSQPYRSQYLPELEAHLEQSHSDYRVSCEVCGGTFRSVRDLNLHVHSVHRSGKAGRARDVVGFKDLTFVDFSSQKFAHIARAECEKSLHRASSRLHPFQCECGLAFPCDSALAIHRQACPNTVYVDSPADLSRGPMPALPSHFATGGGAVAADLAASAAPRAASPRGDFFAKLDLSPHGAHGAQALQRLRAAAAATPYPDRDLADIQTMLGVSVGATVGGLLADGDEREDHEEQQDAFAAEFRRMKQRGEFPCRLCPEVFPNLRALKGHNRAHMAHPGADGYRCNMCPHAALDKVALQRHMRTHNGARPYECALCRFAFTTKANCERHLRNRHAKCSRDEVKSSIIYHPLEDPGNDAEQAQQAQRELQHQAGKLDVKRSLFPEPMLLDGVVGSDEETRRRRSLDVGTMTTSASEDDADDRLDERMDDPQDGEERAAGPPSPLDLSMVLDLSKKRPPSPAPEDDEDEDAVMEDADDALEDEDDEQPQDLSKKSTAAVATSSADLCAAAQPAGPHHSSPSTPMQSPEPAATAAPALPFPLYVNPYQLGQPGQGLGQGLAPGLPFPAAYYPGLLRSLQLGPLAQVPLVLEPMRLLQRPPFLPGPDAAALPPVGADLREDAAVACPAASPKSERSSASESHPPPLSGGSSSGGGGGSSSSKMVMKNGVLMPKQKQRRYRTERPHVCEHCSARFTLSSNRERHVKHQHPQFWSQRHRGPTAANPATPPTPPSSAAPVDASTPLRTAPDLPAKHEQEDDEDEGLVIDEERPSSEDRHHLHHHLHHHHHHDDDGADGDAEDEGHGKAASAALPSAGEDLASVSRLLNNASMQSFRQFLRDGDEQPMPPVVPLPLPLPVPVASLTHHHHRDLHEEGMASEEDVDEEGLVAGSPSEGNNSGSEQDKSESEAAAAPPKKKSAYSLAPNRVCCPYCSRKFPWTSSLRRHVLTHTGQKPYKCTFCPLLFTTKSNCDRHLARKHSNKKDSANNSSSSSGVSSTPNSSTTSVSPGGSASSGSPPEAPGALGALCGEAMSPPHGVVGLYPLRNVPERPYRCRHCPSSTFASLGNLRKHVSTKHTGASLESCVVAGDVGYESHGSLSDAEHVDDDQPRRPPPPSVQPAVQLPVFSPVGLAGLAGLGHDQPLSLCKAERAERCPDAKPTPERLAADEQATAPRRDLDRAPDIMREAHDSLVAASMPVSAPVVSVPEGTPRPPDSAIALPSSELPFKCHLCDGSFTERQECLDHIRLNHTAEYDILVSKKALELNIATSPEDNGTPMDENHHQHHHQQQQPPADGENIEQGRGKFPDYANRKVMCAFCMRRFWSAEDLRRHMRTHTGERPFSCDVCRRRFTLKHSMLRHRKKHNDIANNNNNSLSAPLGPEDLSPSAASGDEDGYKHHTSASADLLLHHVKMTNHNNNNINMAGVNKMLMAICDNQVSLKRNFRRKEEEDSGLISNLLGIGDPSIIDKVLLTKSADDAEKLLGVFQNGSKSSTGRI